jgi:hypothetical protein
MATVQTTTNTSNPRVRAAAEPEMVRELKLFIENDGQLYRSKTVPIQQNLSKKWQKGQYDHAKAPKLWLYLVEEGVKKYRKDHATPDFKVDPATRKAVAQEFADEWEEELKAGNLHASVRAAKKIEAVTDLGNGLKSTRMKAWPDGGFTYSFNWNGNPFEIMVRKDGQVLGPSAMRKKAPPPDVVKTAREHVIARTPGAKASFKAAVPGNLADNTRPSSTGEQSKTVEELKRAGILPKTEKAADYPPLAVAIMHEIASELLKGGRPDLARSFAPVKASLDPHTLDQLVEMEAESNEIDNWKDARATPAVKREAQKFEKDLDRTLAIWTQKYPLKEGFDSDDLMDANGAYVVLMTLMGHGVGIWDGRWDKFFNNPKKDIKALGDFLKRKLSRYADDTGGGSLVAAFRDAAYETTGADAEASFKAAVPGNLADNTKPVTPAEQSKTVEELKRGGILPPGEKSSSYPVLTAKVKRAVIAVLLGAGETKLVNEVMRWRVRTK